MNAILNYEYCVLSSTVIDYVPVTPNITGEYENKLELKTSNINFAVGLKYRLFGSHLSLGAKLLLSYIFQHDYTVTETILGPAELPPFNTYPPSYSREVINGSIPDIVRFRTAPLLEIGYDISIMKGNYIEPSISFIPPTGSYFKTSNTPVNTFSFGVKWYMSFLKD